VKRRLRADGIAWDKSKRLAIFDVIRLAFEAVGAEFIDENGGGPGMRLQKKN
jgi:hypothetical protein